MTQAWPEIAAGLATSVPARTELLEQVANGALLAGLAAAFYRLKEGQAAWLAVPTHSPDDLRIIIQYALQVRTAALTGDLRANAFNRPAMINRPDLVVWTQSHFQHRTLSQHLDLGVQRIRLARDGTLSLAYPGRLCRTLLCTPSGSLTQLCDQLSSHSQPFLQLVDFTVFGVREEASSLLEHLESYFPATPVLILTHCADSTIEPVITRSRRQYALWRQQEQDDTSWLGTRPKTSQLRLIAIPDTRLENPLVAALSACQTLKEQLQRSPSVAKQLLPIFYRVIRCLRGLTYPLGFHEQYLAASRRGGLYPVMPITEWLARAGRITVPTGVSEGTRDQIIQRLQAVLAQLTQGHSGKQQALEHWLAHTDDARGCRAILTSTEADAKALRQWLLRTHGRSLDDGTLRVIGINSARELYGQIKGAPLARALVVCALWDSDLWCLSLASRVDWLGYPLEQRWQQRVVRRFTARQAPCPDQKYAWWQWQPVTHSRVDEWGPAVPCEEWGQCRGQYVHHNALEISLPEDDDWLEALLAPPAEPHGSIDTPPAQGEVIVVTETGACYRYHEHQAVYVLTGNAGHECLETVPAHDLTVGATLVELEEDEVATQGLLDTLIEHTTENSMQYRAYQALVERFHSMIDHAIHHCGDINGFHQALSRKQITIGLAQLRRWATHDIIGPNRSAQVVPAVAALSGMSTTPQQLRSICNAQTHMKGLHGTLGKALKKIVLAQCAPNTAITGNLPLTALERQLSGQVRLETIQRINVHASTNTPTTQTLESLLRAAVRDSGGRLVATPNAYRSARESGYTHLDKARACLDFLSRELFEVYGEKSRSMSSAMAHAKTHNIRFAGDTSDITKGQFSTDYKRPYEGKMIDIGRHIGIGNSWDHTRCLRIHFHWDEQRKQIVIHHAGRHLPTQQG